jgi:hypothetical protein
VVFQKKRWNKFHGSITLQWSSTAFTVSMVKKNMEVRRRQPAGRRRCRARGSQRGGCRMCRRGTAPRGGGATSGCAGTGTCSCADNGATRTARCPSLSLPRQAQQVRPRQQALVGGGNGGCSRRAAFPLSGTYKMTR